jgi:hypothetical protein
MGQRLPPAAALLAVLTARSLLAVGQALSTTTTERPDGLSRAGLTPPPPPPPWELEAAPYLDLLYPDREVAQDKLRGPHELMGVFRGATSAEPRGAASVRGRRPETVHDQKPKLSAPA